MNNLLIAWAFSLIFVVGGILLLEATYTPGEETTEATTLASDTDAQAVEEAEANSTVTDEVASGNTGDSATPNTSPAALPAPGQIVEAQEPNQPSASISIPQSIPIEAIAEMLEQSNFGPLPIIAEDGRKSSDIYAAPRSHDGNTRRIAILLTDLGKKARNTKRAVEDLPASVSLAFSVYGSGLHEWGQKARRAGHEVFLAVPMEPTNYPQNDPGPLTLLTTQSTRVKLNLLRSSLGKFSGYVGITNLMGSRFTAASDSIRPILDELKRRGLMFVDNRDSKYSLAASMAQGINMPWAVNNGYIDNDLNAASIAAQLAELEKRARAQGTAMGIARAYPVTVRAIQVWAATLEERGYSLVPVSSIAGQQALPR